MTISRGGDRIPHFTSKETLSEGVVSGFSVKGRTAHLRALTSEARSGDWQVHLPLVLRRGHALLVLLGYALFSAVVLAAGNRTAFAATRLVAERLNDRALTLAYSAAAGALFVSGVAVRIFGFSFPFWANDTPTYWPGIQAVANGLAPVATPDRPWAYPAVMGTLLRIVPDLRVIVLAQGASSLIAAGCLATTFWMVGTSTFQGRAARWWMRFLGLLTAGLIGLNEAVLEHERAILGEGWMPAFLGIQLLLAWLLLSRQMSWARSFLVLGLISLASLLAISTRPNWGLALGTIPLLWAVHVVRRVSGVRARFAWTGAGVLKFAVLTAAIFGIQAHCMQGNSLTILAYRARALIAWHLPLIQAELERRAAADPSARLDPLKRELSETLNAELATSHASGPGAYPSLGYDADRLFFSGIPSGPRYSQLRIEEQTRFCTELFESAVLHQPARYFHKVASQMFLLPQKVYSPPRISPRKVRATAEQSERAAREFPGLSGELRARYQDTMQQALATLDVPWPSQRRLAWSIRFDLLFEVLRSAFTWSIALPLAMVAIITLVPRLRRGFACARFAPALLLWSWAFGCVLLSALSSALTQGLDVQRYVELTACLALFTQIFGMALMLPLLAHITRLGIQVRRAAADRQECPRYDAGGARS